MTGSLATADPSAPTGIACAQVRGGNRRVDAPFELPGMRGVLSSQPSDGASGGDVYYLSICGSGLLSRICIADVVGHGEAVALVSGRMHALLRRFVDRPDHRRILNDLNGSLVEAGLDAMATAAICTYYPPRRALTFSYAGHPHGWFYLAREKRWQRLSPVPAGDEVRGFVDGALGVSDEAAFTRSRMMVSDGDRLLLVTDGVLETPNEARRLFGEQGLEAVLDDSRDDDVTTLAGGVRAALEAHGGDALAHDDVTILLVEFVPGPAGPALWHVFRNRVLRSLGV